MRSNRPSKIFALSLFCAAAVAPAAAEVLDARAEQAKLAEHIRLDPADYDATFRFVTLSVEQRDYEAGIGALERLLMFNPKLSRARKELGFLYARLGAYQPAAQHLREAVNSPDLDPGQKAQIEAQLPDLERRNQRSRVWGRFQTGFRVQSNANYFPTSNLFQVGGVGLASPFGRRSDVNTFQLLHAAHDYDFENQRGDQLETRFSAYSTQQFELPQYNVALFTGSIGPRFIVPQNVLPNGLSVRPYLLGAASILGRDNYLNTGGGGVGLRAGLSERLTFEPGFEWRALQVNQRGLFNGGVFSSLSTLASGDVITGFVGGGYRATDDIKLEWRAAFSRASAALASQSSDQVDIQAMLRLEVDPPLPSIGRRWTIAPYARFTNISFDAANPLADPFRARHDVAWTYGVTLDAPVNGQFGVAGHLEFSRNDSNLPNFRTNNVSLTVGPTARF